MMRKLETFNQIVSCLSENYEVQLKALVSHPVRVELFYANEAKPGKVAASRKRVTEGHLLHFKFRISICNQGHKSFHLGIT